MAIVNIEKMITIDDTGMPKAPNVRQLQDKDVLLLWSRDTTSDKRKYTQEVGIIYYFADLNSPAKKQGLSEAETLKLAIENYGLPKDYVPDQLVKKLIGKYYHDNITEAGIAIETLHQSIHLISLGSKKLNEEINKKLSGAIADGDVPVLLGLMKQVGDMVKSVPDLVKALKVAYDNLRTEEEEQIARGQVRVMSSMKADED